MFVRLFLGLLFTAMILPVVAAPLSPADRDAVRQQQEQLLLNTQQQRDELERATPLPQPAPAVPAAPSQGPCFSLTTISLTGVTLIPTREQQRLLAPWRNRCLTLADITRLTDTISEWYISRGYITSRAFLTEQDLSHGELTLVVLEGKLRAIHLDGKMPRMLKMAFPGLIGNVLNLRDIEQGMEQINRLRSEPVQIEILPDAEPGYSVVNLTATPEFPLTGSLSLDNSGQKSTGEKQLTATLYASNIAGLADKWFFSGGRSSDFASAYEAQSVQAGLSVPYGYALFDYSYSWNNYRTTFTQRGFDWVSTGDSSTHRFNASWVAFRNGDIKTALAAGVTRRSTRNWLNDALLASSSRDLTSLTLGINHTQKLLGGVATFNPAFSRGMPWFNAESDAGKAPDEPRAAFRKWSLSASYQRPVIGNLYWLTSLYGQWSPDRLYGSERLSLGGESSVRGFKEQYINGDNGGYWRNELNYPLFSLPFIGDVTGTLALDGGWLHRDALDRYAAGTLWGGALGLSTSGRRVSNQISVGTPLQYPDWLGPDHVSVNWRVSVLF
ncbi:ShlB/FhaC/HecB family hemolysin secretion/activation protein [Enterobacteriaceae bacterium]